MKRGEVVFLALTEAKCSPSGYRARKTGCARWLVKQDKGRPVADYTVSNGMYLTGWRGGYMDAAKHRDPLPGAGGPRVHEAPQGIGRG